MIHYLDGFLNQELSALQKILVIQARTNDKNEKAFFTQEESLLRIEMANRIAKVAREAGIDIVVPKKRLVSYANLDGVTEVTKSIV